jgi:hypothetical protein
VNSKSEAERIGELAMDTGAAGVVRWQEIAGALDSLMRGGSP